MIVNSVFFMALPSISQMAQSFFQKNILLLKRHPLKEMLVKTSVTRLRILLTSYFTDDWIILPSQAINRSIIKSNLIFL